MLPYTGVSQQDIFEIRIVHVPQMCQHVCAVHMCGIILNKIETVEKICMRGVFRIV